MEPQHIVRSGTEHCRECRSGIVGGSIPYCNGHWGSMSRALGVQKANILCESGFAHPTMSKGGDLGTDRDAAMGKDQKLPSQENSQRVSCSKSTAIPQLFSGS